ncbi:MAG: hypothetical protein FGM54_07790 [Chitinophagaceae bacterium]|nr:hypothetical protein [Chitinophagaceae bacterium]
MNSQSALTVSSTGLGYPLVGQRKIENLNDIVLDAYVHQPQQYLSLAVFQEQQFQLDRANRLMINRYNIKRLPFLLGSPRWSKPVLVFTDKIDGIPSLTCSGHWIQLLFELCVQYEQRICLHTHGLPEHCLTTVCESLIEKQGLYFVFSIPSTDERIRKAFEPNTPSYAKRLKQIQFWSKHFVPCGLLIEPPLEGKTESHHFELLRQASWMGIRWAVVHYHALDDEQAESNWHSFKLKHVSNSTYKLLINSQKNPIDKYGQYFGLNQTPPFKPYKNDFLNTERQGLLF